MSGLPFEKWPLRHGLQHLFLWLKTHSPSITPVLGYQGPKDHSRKWSEQVKVSFNETTSVLSLGELLGSSGLCELCGWVWVF